MFGRGGYSSSRNPVNSKKRGFSPPRRTPTTYEPPLHGGRLNSTKGSNDKYGGFLNSNEGQNTGNRPLSRFARGYPSPRSENKTNEDDLILTKSVPKCPDLISRGKCSRADCKYDHSEIKTDSSDLTQTLKCKLNEAIRDPSLSGKVEILLLYQLCHVSNYFLYFKPTFQEKPDAYRKWVMAMLELLTTDSANFFRHFQKNDSSCLQIFQTLARADYTATAGPPTQSRYFSFQRCFLPLLFLLSHSEMESTPLRQLTNQIYAIYANHLVDFFLCFLACSMESLSSKCLEDKHFSSRKALEADAGCFVPYSFAQVYYPFVQFLSIIFNRFPELLRTNQTRKLMDALEKELQTWRQLYQNNEIPTLESEFAILIVERAFQPIKEGTNEVIDITATILAKRNKEKELRTAKHGFVDQWPDGPLEAPTGLHDNDFIDYKKIRIIPTMQEILSPHMPVLPGNQQYTPYAHWLEPGPLRLLDTHFRLVRHDMFCSIQLGIKSVLQQLDTFQSSMRFKQRLGYQQVDLMVYTGLSPHKMEFDYNYGSCFSIWYLLPKYSKSNYQLKRFFENCLLRDGLVALIRTPSEGQASPQIYFATVVTKNDEVNKIERGFSTVVLHFVDDGLQTTWMRSSSPFLMVEVRGLMFESYRPILHALQKIEPSNLPFTSTLCSPTPLTRISPPCYMRAGQFKCDLNFLKSSAEVQVNLEFNPMEVDSNTFSELLIQNTTLDNSQATALIAALTQEVCCIQGPPGTGKSYLGVKVIQVLSNPLQDVCFPILILCYTNHALDQFLESLLDEGIKSIARLGSKVSERLKDYQLKNAWGGRGYYIMRKQLEEKIQALEETLMHMNVTSGIQRSRNFWEFLKKRYPAQTWNISKFCREIGVNNYILYWLHGRDLDWQKKKGKKKKSQNKFAFLLQTSSDEEDKNLEEELSDDDFFSSSAEASPKMKGWDLIEDNLLNLYMERLDLNASGTKEKGKVVRFCKPTLSELLEKPDVWSLKLEERKEVHSFWEFLFEEDCQLQNKKARQQLQNYLTEYRELKDQYMLSALKTKKIIGMTTTACAKHIHLIQAIQPKIILCEEAGEVLEAHILASLGRWVQHMILIGDHLQLRPRIQEYSLSVESNEGKKYRLNESLFERLMHVPNFPKYRLTAQRRMRPLISQFIRAITYTDLVDGSNTKSYPAVKGIQNNVYFLDHSHPQASGEESFGGLSHSNLYEVDMIVAMTMYFLQQNYKPEQVVILTPYVGQLMKIREALAQKNLTTVVDDRDQQLLNLAENEEKETSIPDSLIGLSKDNVVVERKDLRTCIRVSSIDNYQGEESDLILISLVRSSFEDGSEKGIGFLSIENRINVMLSRARHGMYVLGNANLLEKKSKVWCKVIQMLRQQGLLGNELPIICQNHPATIRHINTPRALAIEAPDGGCLLPCTIRLPKCGHLCERHCHSDDKDHQMSKCRKPCLQLHEPCKHPCPKLCFKKCSPCETRVADITLPGCGHIYPNPKCWEAQAPSKLVCHLMVEKQRFCGHTLRIECSKDISKEMCTKICDSALECGHVCQRKCVECRYSSSSGEVIVTHGQCKKPCGRQMACRHSCKVLCFEHKDINCPPCKEKCLNTLCEHSRCTNLCSAPCLPCMEKCTWVCEHEPLCPLPCGAPCIRLPCNVRCKKRLKCGHVCPSLCGEPCPSKKYCFECCEDLIRSTRVDLIMLQEYHEIDLNQTPIIILPCGHFFTYETLDCQFQLSNYYRQLGTQFVDVKPFDLGDTVQLFSCPDCRTTISPCHVKRYSRILKRAMLNLNDQHYTVKLTRALHQLESKVNKFAEESMPSRSAPVDRPTYKNSLFAQTNGMVNQRFKDLENQLKQFILDLKKNPSRLVYNAILNFVTQPTLKKYGNNTESQQKGQEKLMDALKKTEIVRNYFVEEGKACLLRYKLHKQYFSLQTQGFLSTGRSSSTGSPFSTMPFDNSILKALALRFEDANRILNQALSLLEQGQGHYRILQAHLQYFDFVSVYLEFIFKLRKSSHFYKLSSNDQEEWYTLLETEVDEVVPQIREAKALAQSLDQHEYDDLFVQFLERFQELKEKMRQNFDANLWELGSIVSALSMEIRGTTGHWYSCPNGHLYVIGECGGAMQESRCIECGVRIGGTSHRLLSDNQRQDSIVQQAMQVFSSV